ncbi:MAG: transposase [Gammaproteobacteria bacterium]|nr:transposase [Gammaproteobacteria bacterium]MDH5617651.1 transposase [Gammaproteobacteria bacterium]
MARFRRLVVPGYPHHVTQRGVRRQKTFFDELDYQNYLRLAADLLARSSIEIWAYCLMPNHIHAIVVPHAENSLAAFFGPLHKLYAQHTNQRYEWTGHLWQARFFSVPMDESHTMSALRYVELNPCRSGLVEKPQDWPWSSARGNLGISSDRLIRDRPTQEVISNWSAYLSEPEELSDLNRLRLQTSTGRPEGTDTFIDRVEALSGRHVRRRSAGRKRK